MRWTSLCTIGLLALSVRSAHAQKILSLRPGTEVEISASSASGTYTVVKVDSMALMLRGIRDTSVIRVPLGEVARISLLRRHTRMAGALTGGMIGLGAGATLGAFIGLAGGGHSCPDDSCASTKAEQKALDDGVAFGVAGILVGAIIGSAHPGSRWEPIVLRSRVGVIRLRHGLGVAISRAL